MRRLDSFEAKDLILWLNEQKAERTVSPASDLHVDPPYLRLQFDVDFSLPWAHRIAELLSAAEIQATFSILVGGSFYDVTSAHGLEGLDRIQALGHDFALHFDARRYLHRAGSMEIDDEGAWIDAIHEGIRKDAAVMDALGFPVAFCNPHRPFRMGLDESWMGGCPLDLPDVGRDEAYVSDSAKGFRDESLELLEDLPERVRLCLHPAWWTVDLPRKETIQARLSQIAQLLQAQAAEWGMIDSHPGATAQDNRDARSGNPKRQARAAASSQRPELPEKRVIVPQGVLANGHR